MPLATPRRTGRRRAVARVLRRLDAGTPPPALSDRLAEMAAESRVAVRDSDRAELIARLPLDDRIPPELAAALCAALLPVLRDAAGGGA